MDRGIYIATATTRATSKWRNKKVPWSRLVEKCSTTTRTYETLAEYKLMKKDQQSNLKDVGGFVGGYLIDGKRSKNHVKFRDVLCLDMDYARSDSWDTFCMTFGSEAFCYSTHKYTSSVPRLRLVILLDRSVSPEEYEAIGRAVAARVGIELFDDTTYEPERLMYWPSTSKDGEWFFEHQEGVAMSADNMLATYHDWRNVSEWPYSSRVSEKVRHEATKQGDPTEKTGIVGAFCRTYDIHSAIETFLSGVYTSAGDNRYTFIQGSVSAGLVIYEGGKFAYSHNSTDPCSQHLVNSFDLVRLHKFGIKDEDTDPDMAVNNRPSYKAMSEFASKDSAVKKQLMTERMASAITDFSSFKDDDSEEPDISWIDNCETTKNGDLKNTIANICAVLENAREFKGKLYYDEFSNCEQVVGRLPWSDKTDNRPWDNADSSCLREHLERAYGLTGKDRIEDALITVTHRHRKHPVREYLRSLTWDGVPRLDTLLIDFLGAEDTELIRMQTRKQFVAAVARVMRPGCKHDYCLVIVGKEGIGKSTLLRQMAGKWFNDSLVSMEGKEGMEALRKCWVIEIGELVSLKRSEVENVKAYISRQTDTYRPPFGKRKEEFPRQCVFFATTNESNFLKGFNGNRRFWIAETRNTLPKLDVWEDLDEAYRNQVWAEAVMRYDKGEKLYLSAELEAESREMQEAYNELSDDERIGIISSFLDTPLPVDWESRSLERKQAYFRDTDPLNPEGSVRRDVISNIEILNECFRDKIDEKARYKTREISALMKRVPGWTSAGRAMIYPYGQQRIYKRINAGINEEENL